MRQKRRVRINPGDLVLTVGEQLDDRIKAEGLTDSALFGHYEKTRSGEHNYKEYLIFQGSLPTSGMEDSKMYNDLLPPLPAKKRRRVK